MQSDHDLAAVLTTMTEDVLARTICAAYQLETPVQCTLAKRGSNEHYLVTAGASRYMLRIYAPGKYWVLGPSDLRFELSLLRYLYARSVPVAYPIRRSDGDVLGTVETPEGMRYTALFSYADGTVVRAIDEAQAHVFGEQVARLHLAANDFRTMYSRYHLDLYMLLDRPMELIRQHFEEARPEDVCFLSCAAEELKAQVRECGIGGDGYGVIHADLHERNSHATGDGRITFFDFDHCGYGWRAYDLAVFLAGKSDAVRASFLEGYQSVRTLTNGELRSLPTFMNIRPIWDAGDMLTTAHLRGGVWAPDGYWERLIRHMRALMAERAGVFAPRT